MSDKKNEFIIRFDGVHLSKEASQRIQNGINDLLLQELAGRPHLRLMMMIMTIAEYIYRIGGSAGRSCL
jgi:hypothetical protein